MKGIIAFFDPRKGYGFVSAESEDIFFHRSALPGPDRHRRLTDCDCEFEIGDFQGRKVAVSVQIPFAVVSPRSAVTAPCSEDLLKAQTVLCNATDGGAL